MKDTPQMNDGSHTVGRSELSGELAANEQTNINNLDKNGWPLSYISGQQLDMLWLSVVLSN